jgi:hypothetical protein
VRLFQRVSRATLAAFLAIGVLVGPSVLSSPAVAFALPGDPSDPCVPQSVKGSDAELSGTLRLLEAAIVGSESRISMQGASVRLPNPRCDGDYLDVPLVYRWDLLSRPAGGTASLTSTNSLVARLTPDAAGTWQVAFTACPNGCRVTGTTITVPPLQATLSVNASDGIEGHLTSDFLDSTLKLDLIDSRIQVSHTGAGTNVNGTPYDVAYYPLTPLYQRMCLDVADPPQECDRLEEQMMSHVTFHTITPSFSSFIDFGPTAVFEGAPEYIVLPVEPHEHEIPTWKRAALLALQGFGLVSAIDVDRVRILANDIHLEFKDIAKWHAFVGGGSVNLKMSFDSAHPTIKCEAHYTQRVGFIFSVDSGWADELCPDYDLSQMDMTISLFPVVLNDGLTVADAQVAVQMTPQGIQSDLIDFFLDVSDRYEVKIADKVRARLVEAENRAKLGTLLTKIVKHRFSDLVRIRSSRIAETDWVVRSDRG